MWVTVCGRGGQNAVCKSSYHVCTGRKNGYTTAHAQIRDIHETHTPRVCLNNKRIAPRTHTIHITARRMSSLIISRSKHKRTHSTAPLVFYPKTICERPPGGIATCTDVWTDEGAVAAANGAA